MSTFQKTRMAMLSKIFPFCSKIPIPVPIFIRNKSYPNDPTDELFPVA